MPFSERRLKTEVVERTHVIVRSAPARALPPSVAFVNGWQSTRQR